MADYKKMYLELFNGVTDAIDVLQKSQIKAENLYMDSNEDSPIFINPKNKKSQ